MLGYPALDITISKTRQGHQDYMQITCPDQVTLNIFLISYEIRINDTREADKEKE